MEDSIRMPHSRPEDAAGSLAEARERTLAIVSTLSDEQVEAAHDPLMGPLAWDLAHIAAYEDLWLAHRHGGLPLLHPERAVMYDAFETPRAVRGRLPLLDREGAVEYLATTRARSLEVLARRGPGDGTLLELVLRHEQQHDETMLQAIELAQLPAGPGMPRAPRPPAPVHAAPSGLERVEVPAGRCHIGAPPDRFSYDNERPRQLVDVPAFAIGRVPVTNGDYLEWLASGGYDRREWWSDAAWAWKEQYDITRPHGWVRADGGDWWHRRIDGLQPLDPSEPVVHVAWFEADAFARAHGARLPTEVEWEKAATWDQDSGEARPLPWGDERPVPADGRANLDHGGFGPFPAGALPAGAAPCGALGMIGDVWEWTSSPFCGYPGFRPHPYREYSEVFFGHGHRVLRGGSWATRCDVAGPTFRNWDLPQRRQIFAGFRLAWSVAA